MSKLGQDSDLIAALVWDQPALAASDGLGAHAFVDAMNLRPIREPASPDDPLGIAAGAILDEMSGNAEAALRAYERLAGAEADLIRLLGLSLRCWSQLSPEPILVGEAQAQVEQVDDLELRARLTTKLIAAAFDHGWDELLPVLFAQAKEWAPADSMLFAAVENEAYNLLGSPLALGREFDPDQLTTYQWIQDLAADAAHTALRKAVENKARSPWTLSFGFGPGDLNAPLAAEMQARWAGAIWLRRDLQAQLASHLLNGSASSPSQYASAVTLWALGRGEAQLREVIVLAEANFDDDSADFVVSHLRRSGDVAARFDPRLLEAAVECWDLISESNAVALLDRFRPVEGDHPFAQRIATLWSLLSVRVPEAWLERFTALSDSEAIALLATTTPAVAARLPRPAAQRLYGLGHAAESDLNAMLLRASLARRLEVEGEYMADQELPAIAVIRLATRTNHPVDPSDLESAVLEMTDEARRVVADAREGRGGMGLYDPLKALAAGLAQLGSFPATTLRLLTETATDARVPRHVRYDAVKALSTAAGRGAVVSSDLAGLVEAIPEAGAEPFWDEYSRPLMQAAKAQLAMASGEVTGNIPQVLVLSRDPEVRVRMDAIDACILGRRVSDNEMLESILLNALFDPRDDVVRHAVAGFTERPPQRPAAQAAVAKRLAELFDTADREVRAGIARLATSRDLPAALVEPGAALVDKASRDRSFSVRDALQATVS